MCALQFVILFITSALQVQERERIRQEEAEYLRQR